MYNKLVAKIDAIDTNAQYNTEKKIDDADKKIPDTRELVNAKITHIEEKIYIITGLATTSALNTGC